MKVETTHIGSLPFVQLNQAIEFTFKFDIPVLFTLPHLDPKQFMGIDVLSRTHNLASLDIELPYEKEFFKRLASQDSKIFKTQLIGPITLHKYFLKDQTLESVASKLGVLYKNLINRFIEKGDLFLVIDEPALKSRSEIEFLNEFFYKLNIVDCEVGLHCCSDINEEIFELLKIKNKQLDWSLRNKDNFNRDEVFLGGLEMRAPETWGNFLFSKKNLIISPACGLANESNPEMRFQRLTELKTFLETL
ncbi:MAG: hypothetical protein CME65_06160 [Halobacteriovoraceae bacterium]|nr:hypothetical protein [Halobacteriovoraceae bacterium]